MCCNVTFNQRLQKPAGSFRARFARPNGKFHFPAPKRRRRPPKNAAPAVIFVNSGKTFMRGMSWLRALEACRMEGIEDFLMSIEVKWNFLKIAIYRINMLGNTECCAIQHYRVMDLNEVYCNGYRDGISIPREIRTNSWVKVCVSMLSHQALIVICIQST